MHSENEKTKIIKLEQLILLQEINQLLFK